MTDTEIKMIKNELNKLAKQDEFSNIHECTLKLINLYEAIILGNQMEIEELKKNIEELVDKKTALEKRIFELEKENEDLKAEIGLNEATIQEQLEDRVKVIKENEELKKEIDCYKAFESHYDEIEEDAKAIAKENEDLKNQIEQMKCCGNCQSVFDADERSNKK